MTTLTSLPTPVRWPYAAILLSLFMIAAAHAFETFVHLFPCTLCLRQREVYWAAAGLAIAGLFVSWRWPFARLLPTLNTLLGVIFLAGAGVAAYHAGVEWGVFPAPDTCVAGSTEGLDGGLLDDLSKPMVIGSCTEAPWRFLGLSLAGWNALASIGFAGVSFISARRPISEETAHERAETLS